MPTSENPEFGRFEGLFLAHPQPRASQARSDAFHVFSRKL